MIRTQIIPAHLQPIIDAVNNQELIVAEIALKPIAAMPDYDQVIRIKDTIINLSDQRFIPKPKRILVHKVTNEEIDLNLPVPDWDINALSVSAMIDENGDRILVETHHQNEVGGEVVEITHEPIHLPALQYLTFLSHQFTLPVLYGKFLQQYVDDEELKDELIFTRLK